MSAEHRERIRSQGSLVLIADFPEFGKLPEHQALSHILKETWNLKIQNSALVTISASHLRAQFGSGIRIGVV